MVSWRLPLGMARMLVLGMLLCSCGGRALVNQTCPDMDASPRDATTDTTVEAGRDAKADAPSDAPEDATWASHFDANYNRDYPPAPGEYPDPSGGLCGQSDTCAAGAGLCDFQSGWCCHGRFTTDRQDQAECLCGQSLGCAPPEVCCSAYGATVSVCMAAARDCNGVAY
jgi:hypothetical protein